MKILTLSSLYPNVSTPGRGSFIENKLLHLKEYGGVESRIVSPLFHFPLFGRFMDGYQEFNSVPAEDIRQGLHIYYPKYFQIPAVSMTISPYFIAHACLPILKRLQTEGFDFDLIDAHYAYPDGVAACMLAHKLGKDFTITALGSDINILPNYAGPRRHIQKALKNAAAVIGVSRDLCEKMVTLGADPEKTHAVYNGVDLDLFCPGAANRYGLSGTILLSIGNLIELKGHDLIIRALERLTDCSLIIAGSGPEEGNLKKLVADLGLASRVVFAGRLSQKELPALYNAADIFVLASRYEGMANVLLESLACATPLVATPIAGMEEVISCPEAGLIMDTRSVEDMVNAITKLRDHYPDKAKIRRYATRFNWRDTSAAQIEIFTRIVTSKDAGSS